MPRQRDPCLYRAEASRSELCISCAERLAAAAQTPGDAHQGVTVLRQSLAADPSTSGDRRGLIARRRKASGRVEMFRAREALDRQRECTERRGPDDRDAGQACEDLPRGLGQQHGQLLFGQGDVLLQRLPAAQISSKAPRPQLGIERWLQEPLPALRPEHGRRIARAAGCPGQQRTLARSAPGERGGAGEHRLTCRGLQLQCAPVPGRR
jgi:hypothetical protein